MTALGLAAIATLRLRYFDYDLSLRVVVHSTTRTYPLNARLPWTIFVYLIKWTPDIFALRKHWSLTWSPDFIYDLTKSMSKLIFVNVSIHDDLVQVGGGACILGKSPIDVGIPSLTSIKPGEG